MKIRTLFAATLSVCGAGVVGAAPRPPAEHASAFGPEPAAVGAPLATAVLVAAAAAAETASASTGVGGGLVVPLAAEGQSFQVLGTMAVQYGAGADWVTRSVSGTGTCTAAFFGVTAAGSGRVCQTVVASSLATDGTAPSVGLPATEGGTFYVYGTRTVEYGVAGSSLRKVVTGRGQCGNAFFDRDPAYGTAKSCALVPPASATSAVAAWLPTVDASKIPPPAAGSATARVRAANVADPSQNPVRSDIGNFREYCEFSHMSTDDPIVAPNARGPHLHTFLGNTGTRASSTAASIAGSGNSTCAGGILNRTAYWVPAVIDTTDGTPQKPLGSLIYYKQGYDGVRAASIRPFPAGLRIVAGSAASTGPQAKAGFTCYRPDGRWATTTAIPPDCPVGSTLTIAVNFPQCWDGINLDAPDHRAHMAYARSGCPATHPVALAGITFEINYRVGPRGTSRWRLASDDYDTGRPGGYSSHADWFNGWDPTILNVWTTRCINPTLDCHAFLIGDGRILY